MLQQTVDIRNGNALARAPHIKEKKQLQDQKGVKKSRIGLLLLLTAFIVSVPALAENQIFMYGSSTDFQFTGTGGNIIDVDLPSAGCNTGTFCLAGDGRGTGAVSSSIGTYVFSSTDATPFTLAAATSGGFAVSQSLPIDFSFISSQGTLMGSVQFTSASPSVIVNGSFRSRLSGTLTVTGGTFAGVFGSSAAVNLIVALHFRLGGLVGTTSTDTAEIDTGSTVAAAPACAATANNPSNFNGTSVPAETYLWFNANFQATNVPSGGATIDFTHGNISFTAGGTSYSLAVPNARVTFSSSASCTSTTFDSLTNTWMSTVPLSGDDEIFLTGLAWAVPSGGLPGGANPVNFSGTYSSETDAPGLSIQMKWSVAAYSKFTTDYNTLQVKAGHQTACGQNNGDHAGTPEGVDNTNTPWKQYLVGGPRGGGGSNFTGSWSGTLSIPICP